MEINWKKLFDWSVVGVQRPYPLCGAGRVFAYCVDVMYQHHGFRRVMFPVERKYKAGQEFALSQATDYFERMYAKMQRGVNTR